MKLEMQSNNLAKPELRDGNLSRIKRPYSGLTGDQNHTLESTSVRHIIAAYDTGRTS